MFFLQQTTWWFANVISTRETIDCFNNWITLTDAIFVSLISASPFFFSRIRFSLSLHHFSFLECRNAGQLRFSLILIYYAHWAKRFNYWGGNGNNTDCCLRLFPPPLPPLLPSPPSSHSAQMLHHFFFRLSLSDESRSMRWDAKFGNRRITKKKLSFETVV